MSNGPADKTLIDPGIASRQAEIRKEHERMEARSPGSEARTEKLEKVQILNARMAFEQAGTATLQSPPPASMEISAETKARREKILSRGPGAEVGKVYSLHELALAERSGWKEVLAARVPKAREVEKSIPIDQRVRNICGKEKERVQDLLERSKRELTPAKEVLLEKIDLMKQKMLRSRGPAHATERPQIKTLGVDADFEKGTVSARARDMMRGPKKNRDRDR